MLTVIFGAGASYDSIGDFRPSVIQPEARPPLADELFGRRALFAPALEAYPECVPLVQRLRWLRSGTSLETELDEIAAEAETDARRPAQLNAIRYYLRAIILASQGQWMRAASNVTNYATLLDQIWNWQSRTHEPVRLVTFNYDTMLETAAELSIPHVRFANDVRTYIEHPFLRIYKPHGSVTWSRVLDNRFDEIPDRSERGIIALGSNVEPTNTFVMAMGPELSGRVLMPALAVPLRRKPNYEFPPEHLAMLKSDIAKTTRILVIGWRATDEPFLELMRDSIAGRTVPLQVVTGSGDGCEQVYDNLTQGAGLTPKSYDPVAHGFSEYVLDRGIRRLLDAQV